MKKSFTLIELLVVIAIIGILSSMLLPALVSAREMSKTSVCLSQLRQTNLAYLMYSSENNDKTLPKFPIYPTKTQIWLGAIYPYHENADLYKCPSVTHIAEDVDSGGNVHGTHKTGWAGESGYWSYGGNKGRGSYAINAWTWSADKDGLRTSDNFIHHLAEAENSSNTPLFFDSTWIDAQPNRNQTPESVDGTGSNSAKRIYLDRHYQKKVNYTMLDGNAKTIKINKLYHLDWNQNFLYKDLPLF
ncbi:MAG: type II secretion system GspH family protein [Lentisphaeraceae bacterium]|nr:type II secretion system GspH family protein [Lentisphaeraceae bacterium]